MNRFVNFPWEYDVLLVVRHSRFPYFCSNLVKLDELDKLEKIHSDSVETV